MRNDLDMAYEHLFCDCENLLDTYDLLICKLENIVGQLEAHLEDVKMVFFINPEDL